MDDRNTHEKNEIHGSLLGCIINDKDVETGAPAGTVTLDFIRRYQKLHGTKEGCREGECGACTVLIGELKDNDVHYRAVNSCLLPLGELTGKHLVTVEGINITGITNPDALTPVQQALTDEAASQCGFCTPGFVMSLTGFFLTSETLGYQDALDALDGNICRCTGYLSICRAAQKLSETFAPMLDKTKNRIQQLVEWHVLPPYFNQIPARLKALETTVTTAAKDTLDTAESSGTAGKAANKGVIIAGATDLYVQKAGELLHEELQFISRRKDLSYIRQRNNMIYIGAGTTTEELRCSALLNNIFPNFKEYINLISSTIIRNRATLVGNIVNASPVGYLAIMLLVLDTHLGIFKERTLREVPLKQFFKGYKQMDLEEGEVIRYVRFPVPNPQKGLRFHFHFEKVSQRKHLDIAAANTAIYIETDEHTIHKIRLSAGGVAPIPLYLEKTCTFLEGKEITRENLHQAADIMTGEISPIDSVRGSAQYKTLLLRNLFLAHFITLFPGKELI